VVIDSSNNHIVVIKFDDDGEKILHCEIMEWKPSLKRHLTNLLKQLGTCYTTVDNIKSLNFNLMLGAQVLAKQDNYTILRYN
jgi:hypothetical protein